MQAETIENNVRKLIIDESPINPKYYEKMSELLDALIAQRKQEAMDYAAYLAKIVELTRRAKNGPAATAYPAALNTPALRALYDNLGNNEALALTVDLAVRANRQDDWRNNPFKVKKIRNAIKDALARGGALTSSGVAPAATTAHESTAAYMTGAEDQRIDPLGDVILKLVTNQNEY